MKNLNQKKPVNYYDPNYMDLINTLLLNNCKTILGLDVVGPESWQSFDIFRYLAPQIKQYIRTNVIDNEWQLVVSEEINFAMERSIHNATHNSIFSLEESLTEFDNPSDFEWNRGDPSSKPRLEYSRILLWSKEEIISEEADSVIAIHEAFHIPLFFLETKVNDNKRNLDYLLFEDFSTNKVCIAGDRKSNYNKARPLKGKNRIERIKLEYIELLNHPKILFATDAREIFLRKTNDHQYSNDFNKKMNISKDFVNESKSYIKDGMTDQALNNLIKHRNFLSTKIENEILFLSNRYKRITKEYNNGMISISHFELVMNQLNKNLLDILSHLNDNT